MNKKAAILIIGNEILSGKTVDTNSPYLAKELRSLGVQVSEIAVIPDDVKRIAEVCADFSNRFDYVFSTGGVGPTHDDVTMEGIALGFGRTVIRNPILAGILKGWYRDEMNEARLKMADTPEGSTILEDPKLGFPVVVFQNVFIFPGIPKLLREKFEAIKERFRESPFHLRILYSKTSEGMLADHLNALIKRYPELLVGSYPEMDNPSYRVKVTVESKDLPYLEKAFQDLLESLPENAVFKIEPETAKAR